MGGFGSGRRNGPRRSLVEGRRALDANRLHKAGYLQSGSSACLQWPSDGDEVAAINVRTEFDWVHLVFRIGRARGGGWDETSQIVRVVRVPCRFGGSRPYFLCPGNATGGGECRRRVVKLYEMGGYFICRGCSRLSYGCQREARWDRLLRKAGKIRLRLGGTPGVANAFPPKPKGAWRKNYERWREKALEAERRAYRAVLRHDDRSNGCR